MKDQVWVQLATRIPKTLHRAVKVHCVNAEVSLMDFVVEALQERLTAGSKSDRRRLRA
jgi:predicted HicB family RNase H-like nuclease